MLKKYINRKKIIMGVAIIMIMLAGTKVIYTNHVLSKYNEKVDQYNKVLEDYNNVSEDIKSHDPAVAEKKYLSFENVISCEDIKEETDALEYVKNEMNSEIEISDQINNPTVKWVDSALEKVEGITGTQAVTKSDNPDGLLDKEHGYTGCLYFTVKDIDPSKVKGKTIVDKGTDAGGAIEIYATREDAEARDEYLTDFDKDPVLDSGSHTVLGKMVIRTSYKLDGEKQMKLNKAIIDQLTVLNEDKK